MMYTNQEINPPATKSTNLQTLKSTKSNIALLRAMYIYNMYIVEKSNYLYSIHRLATSCLRKQLNKRFSLT